jgi:hypothetical protein
MLSLLLQLQISQTISNLGGYFHHFHPRLDHQLAGERLAWLAFGLQFVGDAAVLTFFVPAEAPHRNVLWSKILQSSQQHVAFRHPKLFSEDFDHHEFVEGTVERAGRAHEVRSF